MHFSFAAITTVLLGLAVDQTLASPYPIFPTGTGVALPTGVWPTGVWPTGTSYPTGVALPTGTGYPHHHHFNWTAPGSPIKPILPLH